MSPRALHDSLWVLESPMRAGPLELGTRTAIVRRADGGLVVHSPGPIAGDGATEAAVAALGPVRALIAPNALHHLFLGAWSRAFPEAECFAAPGVAAKQPELKLVELGAAPPPAWAGTLDQLPLAGMPRVCEVAFFHPASRSLILTDLCFHVRRGPWLTRALLRVNGAWDRFGMSRIGRSLVRDRAALRRSLDALLEWDFDRIVVAHGDVLEHGGRAALREAFAWLDNT